MALQRLTQTRYHLMQALIRESNFLMTNLYLKFSDYTLVFDNKISATSLAVMEEFQSVEALAEASLDELTQFLIQHGKNRFDNPGTVAKELQKAARSSYRLPKTMADSVNLPMASSTRVIGTIQEQLKFLKRAIEDHLDTIPQTLDSMPGIGPIFASGILAEIGDINQFDSYKQMVSSQTWSGYNINQETILPTNTTYSFEQSFLTVLPHRGG